MRLIRKYKERRISHRFIYFSLIIFSYWNDWNKVSMALAWKSPRNLTNVADLPIPFACSSYSVKSLIISVYDGLIYCGGIRERERDCQSAKLKYI